MRRWAGAGRRAVLLAACLLFAAGAFAAERTVDVRSLLQAFGIAYVTNLFSDELNSAINTLTLRHTPASQEATKVVPIVSVGTGAYVGAAQVTGPAERVERVQAVGQLEGDFLGGDVRAKALVPLDSVNPLAGMRRVQGVGVLAIVDLNVETPVVASPPQGGTGPTPGSHKRHRAPRLGSSEFLDGRFVLFARDEITVRGNQVRVSGVAGAGNDVRLLGNRQQVTTVTWEDGPELPSFASGRWKERARRTYPGNRTLRDLRVQGIVYVDGDVRLEGEVRGRGVLAVNGDVTLDARRVSGPGLLIVARGDVLIGHNHAAIEAAILAPGGEIRVQGNNLRFKGVIAADRVQIRGNSGEYAFDPEGLKQL